MKARLIVALVAGVLVSGCASAPGSAPGAAQLSSSAAASAAGQATPPETPETTTMAVATAALAPSKAPAPSAATRSPAVSASPAPSGFEGRAFRATSIIENGKPRDLVTGSTIDLTFNTDWLELYPGCNEIAANFRTSGGRVIIKGYSISAMAYDPALMAQDDWAIGFLSSRPRITSVGSGITLASRTIVITFEERPST